MLRTSSFLTIALSVTAIGSAAVPAAAYPLQAYGGGSNHLSQLPMAAPPSTHVQASREASHVLGPQKIVSLPPKIPTVGPSKVSLGNAEQPMPASHGGASMKNAEIPQKDLPPPDICATHPYLSFCKGGSGSGGGGGSGSGSGGGSGGAGGSGSGSAGGGKGAGSGPVVVVVPQPPIQGPVRVPVAVPVPVRVGTGSGVAAQARPAIVSQPVTSQCLTADNIPALAAGIDQLLPTAQLSEADMSKVTELRQMIQVLSIDGKAAAARDVEEIAMNLLGYQKVWLRCGLGTFDWEKQVASTDAGQQK